MQLTSFDFKPFSNDDVIKGTSKLRKNKIWGRGGQAQTPAKKFENLPILTHFSVTLHTLLPSRMQHTYFYLTFFSNNDVIKRTYQSYEKSKFGEGESTPNLSKISKTLLILSKLIVQNLAYFNRFSACSTILPPALECK